MQCRDFQVVVEQEGLTPLPEAARSHVAGCRHCQAFVADLATIVSLAHELPAEVGPPARVWTNLRAQLVREEIIRERGLDLVRDKTPWWQGLRNLFAGRALATAAVGLLILGAAVLEIRTERVGMSPPPPIPGSLAASRTILIDQEPLATGMILASSSPVDASLRENLQKVDDFIAECERHLKEQPQDDLAREYLTNAYQQKAELLSAMIDRGGSVQ